MKRLLNLGYGAIHATYWMYYGVIGSFTSVFLLDKGYANKDIGMMFAAGSIVAIFLQPLMADIGDRSKRYSVFEILVAAITIMLIGAVCLFVIQGKSTALTFIFIGLIAWCTALQPMVNYLAFKLSTCGLHINFGVARSGGSLGYSLLCIYLGNLVERRGTFVIPVVGVIVILALLAVIFIVRYNFKNACAKTGKGNLINVASTFANKGSEIFDAGQHGDAELEDNDSAFEKEEINLIDFLKRNKVFFILNIGVIFVFFNNSIVNNFMYQVVTDVGGNSDDMGKIFSLMAIVEMPTLILFDKISQYISCRRLLIIGSVAFILKTLCFFVARTTTMMYVAQVFQPIAFALFLPAMVHFIDQVMSQGEAVKGQALFTTMITVSTVVASIVGGMILDSSGAKTVLMLAVILAALGAMLTILFVNKVPVKEE